jgi:copper(I)-binding protein
MFRFPAAVVAAFSLVLSPAHACEEHDRLGASVITAQHNHSAANSSVKVGTLVIDAPWTRATPAGAKVAGGYMSITNTGTAPDRLIGGSFPLAGRFEVHEMAVNNGIMTMRELGRGLEIGPGQKVELKPGGLHVMFMDLKSQVREGQPVKGTLVFEKAGTVEVDYRVAPIGARAPGAHAH